jgi:5-methylcytosine-specific restriction protein A
MKRACAYEGCLLLSFTGESYCAAHQDNIVKAKRARRNGAPGDGAARRLRSVVRASNARAQCNTCKSAFGGTQIEIDHVVAIGSGGHDVASNLQLLCRACHRAKTKREQGTYTRGQHGR